MKRPDYLIPYRYNSIGPCSHSGDVRGETSENDARVGSCLANTLATSASQMIMLCSNTGEIKVLRRTLGAALQPRCLRSVASAPALLLSFRGQSLSKVGVGVAFGSNSNRLSKVRNCLIRVMPHKVRVCATVIRLGRLRAKVIARE